MNGMIVRHHLDIEWRFRWPVRVKDLPDGKFEWTVPMWAVPIRLLCRIFGRNLIEVHPLPGATRRAYLKQNTMRGGV